MAQKLFPHNSKFENFMFGDRRLNDAGKPMNDNFSNKLFSRETMEIEDLFKKARFTPQKVLASQIFPLTLHKASERLNSLQFFPKTLKAALKFFYSIFATIACKR